MNLTTTMTGTKSLRNLTKTTNAIITWAASSSRHTAIDLATQKLHSSRGPLVPLNGITFINRNGLSMSTPIGRILAHVLFYPRFREKKKKNSS